MKGKLNIKKIIIISIITILSLVVILLAALLLIKEKNDYYFEKCESFEVQNFNLSDGQIVFIGDSITDLYLLDDYYSDLDLACYNRGISGDFTLGVLNRLEVSVFDLNPSVIVLMIGTNDINGGRSVDALINSYKMIIDKIYEKLPNVTLYCMSIIPQNKDLEEYTELNVDNNNTKVIEANIEISKLCQENNIAYLDIYSKLLDENNYLDKKYSDDGIHLNANGFQVWTELLKPYLLEEVL